MVGSRRVQGAGSARTEGARRATGFGADGAAVGAGALAPGQRWSASRKRDVVLRLLRGESLDAVSREVGLEVYRLEAWKARALAGLELGLKAQGGEPLAAELDAAKRHIGELSMEIELLRERARAAECRLPTARLPQAILHTVRNTTEPASNGNPFPRERHACSHRIFSLFVRFLLDSFLEAGSCRSGTASGMRLRPSHRPAEGPRPTGTSKSSSHALRGHPEAAQAV